MSPVIAPPDPYSALDEALGAEAAALVRESVEREFTAGGKELFRQGDAGDALYVIEHGRLRAVQRDARGERRVLQEMGRGEVVGELALLTGEPRGATVEAVRDTWLWMLPKEAFDQLVEKEPRASLALARQMARRALGGGRRRVLPTSALTLLAGGRAPVDMRAFSEKILAALAPRRPLLVDRRTVDRALGEMSADGTVRNKVDPLGSLLNDLEARHPLLVYLADPTDSVWTGRCIRQADRILLVVGGDDPGLGEAEARLLKGGKLSPTARTELVRVLPDDTVRPQGTLPWLAARAVDAHHHVRLSAPADFARLARLVAGRPIGVALSGGGARAIAHTGLLRALGEAGVPVDLVAGTSVGSFVGAQFARGDEPRAIAERAVELSRTRMFDPTMPFVSVFAGYGVRRLLRRVFGDAQLEDVWTPCYLVSADLLTAEAVVHDRGPLWLAVRASGSVPAVLPPVSWGDHLLVDGGVLNNLPADVVRDRGIDPVVIASDVGNPGTTGWNALDEVAISGWRVLWRRLLGRPTPPGSGEVLMRAATLAAARHLASITAGEADLSVRPPIEQLGTFDAKAVPEAARIGYEHARRVVDGWLASGRLAPGGWGEPREPG